MASDISPGANGENPMDPTTGQCVDALVELRTRVDERAKEASEALDDFAQERDDGSFWKDSATPAKGPRKRPNITTTARAYVAKMAADRRRGQKKGLSLPAWSTSLQLFAATPRIFEEGGSYYEVEKKEGSSGYELQNAFDLAHISDFLVVSGYLDRFYPRKRDKDWDKGLFGVGSRSSPPSDAPANGDAKPPAAPLTPPEPDIATDNDPIPRLLRILKKTIKDGVAPARGKYVGEVHFVSGSSESAHYFATLHVLRALHVLANGIPEDMRSELEEILEAVRSFSIAQSHYFHRNLTNKQDPLRLAFAGCIYASYDPHVDKDLCLSIIEALAKAQHPDGSWPATHPVIRERQVPWHISSHEVALCLTWLYFQPRIPDAARSILVDMMRRYFSGTVVQTYRPGARHQAVSEPKAERNWRGWQDDHTRSESTTVGWATAVVCHFLGNFGFVLDDWINRQIIEDLGLALTTQGYLIDETVSHPSPRWAQESPDCATWPDMPPAGWKAEIPEPGTLGREVAARWTDPDDKKQISHKLGELVLRPIFTHPAERPSPRMCAGLLPGKPGTRKTSLVRRISEVAEWPMVSVPASLIFAHGFEMMEAEASRVFRLLNHLRRCVIFFDEFEEFFVSRDKSAYHPVRSTIASFKRLFTSEDDDDSGLMDLPLAFESRTIAAFTTSAMLPRLQELHDEDRCLIFLATNWLKKLDPAIIRRGRFDYMITVGHPSYARVKTYVQDLQLKATPQAELKGGGLVQHPYKEMLGALGRLPRNLRRGPVKFVVIEELERRGTELMRECGDDFAALENRLLQELQDLLVESALESPGELARIQIPAEPDR